MCKEIHLSAVMCLVRKPTSSSSSKTMLLRLRYWGLGRSAVQAALQAPGVGSKLGQTLDLDASDH